MIVPWHKVSTERFAAIPIESGNPDVVCYKCGKRSHAIDHFYTKAGSSAKATRKKLLDGGAKNQNARRLDSA